MSGPAIHGVRRVVSASAILSALGDGLSAIRQHDGLTWADLGAVLGKSEDQAAKYADGSAEMGAVALYRAKQAWNGRFTGAADKLIEEARETVNPRRAESMILRASLCLSIALEDGDLSNAEIAANRAALENGRDAIDALLSRLTPRAARA
jgi:hypothetical protein